MTFPGLVRANNLNDIVDQEKAWDNLGDGIATGDISIATPSLDLNFAANKSLVDDISGNNLITFSRASTGTFVGSNGLIQTAASGVPRFDHNPTTGESLGLLVEEARTNFALYSQQVGNWNLAGVTATGNSIVAPDGTITATLLTDNSSTTTHGINRTFSNNQSTTTFSVYVKRGTARHFAIGGQSTTPEASACFDFDNPTTITYQAGSISNFSSASLIAVGNGWYRVVVTHSGFGGSSSGSVFLFILNSQPANSSGMSGFSPLSYAGSSSLSIYWWGFQIEQAAFPTSYIPTVASAVTRAADVASITGANFSSWFNATQGSFVSNSIWNGTSLYGNPFIWSIDNGTYDQKYAFYAPSNATRTLYISSPAGTATASAPSNSSNKVAFNYSANQQTAFRGGFVGGSTANTYPTGLNRFTFSPNQFASSASPGSIHHARLTYWPSRLNSNALQYITQPSINTINLYSFSYSVTGKEVLALNAVRNTSTRDFIFIKGLLSSVQPRLTTASQNTSSGVLLDSFAMPKLVPTTSGNYFFSSGVTLSGVTTRINGTNASSIATSPFSGSTATAPLLFRELRPQANWRITEPMPSGTIASPSLAIPFETNDFVLFIKAGQN